MKSVRLFVVLAAGFGICGSPASASPEPSDSAGGSSAMPHAFFEQHCVRCHGSEKSESGFRLDRLRLTRPGAREFEPLQAVLDRLLTGTMPPEDEPQPSPAHVEQAVESIRSLLGVHGDVVDITQLPGFGNAVDHETLFTEPPMRRAATPARLWRVSPHIYATIFNRAAGAPILVPRRQGSGGELHPSLPFMTPNHSFRDYALVHEFEEATTDLAVNAAWELSGYQVNGPPELDLEIYKRDEFGQVRRKPLLPEISDVAPPFRRVMNSHDPSDDDVRAAIQYQFQLVLQREPKSEELKPLIDLFMRSRAEADVEIALRTMLAAVLLTPESLFRVEIGRGETDEHGRTRLTPNEIAFAVSYALTDAPPDERLLEAAHSGRLDRREDVEREVRRLLDDEHVAKPRLLRFFQEYFEYPRAVEVFKDVMQKSYMPWNLVKDADHLVLSILADDRDVLRRLLTTRKMFVNYNGGDRPGYYRNVLMYNIHNQYNFSRDWEWSPEQPIDLTGQRAGILTHPAWLLAFSDNEKNQVVQRGHWIRTKLLGGTVPDVPIGVDAQLSDDPTLTVREKMLVTRQEYCWKCHHLMDPLGLPFEQFSHMGLFRTEELGRPVDASGELTKTGDPDIEGPVSDPFEFVDRLASSRRVQQVFVRHAFRYWLGRNETLDDAPTLIDADRAYTEGGGSMKELIVSLLTSDSFLYRRLPDAHDMTAARTN